MRPTCLALVLCATAACGGIDSSSVLGNDGSAVAMNGAFKGTALNIKDAASAVLAPSTSFPAILALMFSDTTGICQQANTNFSDDTTLFLVVLQDATGAATPPEGTYTVTDASGSADGSVGSAIVAGLYQADSFVADAGSVVIALQASTQAHGTSSGSVNASTQGASVLVGKFEAPECDALRPLVEGALGISD